MYNKYQYPVITAFAILSKWDDGVVPALVLRGVLVTVFSFLSKVFSLYDMYAKGEDHRFIKKRSAMGGGNAGWPWMARRIASATINTLIDWRKCNASIYF